MLGAHHSHRQRTVNQHTPWAWQTFARTTCICVALSAILGPATSAAADDFRTLYSFTGSDGDNPNPGLVAIGSTLYGTTLAGGWPTPGSNALLGEGTIFAINSDGSSFKSLYRFGALPGSTPFGDLVAIGSNLYSATRFDVTNKGVFDTSLGYGYGTIFSMSTNGTTYGTVHSFDADNNNAGGQSPSSPLLGIGSTLYGATTGAPGTIYSINADGSNYHTLQDVSATSIVVSGTTIFDSDGSSLFSMNLDGSGFEPLISVPGGISGFVVSGSTIFGTSGGGGDTAYGSLFSLNTDGSNFHTLHSFTGTGPDGAYPLGALNVVGDKLFGTSQYGGPVFEYGNIFSINADGSDFQIVHSFVNSDGAHPAGGMLLDGSTLYGVTPQGGAYGAGTIFAIDVSAALVPEPSTWALAVIGLGAFVLIARRSRLTGIHTARGVQRLAFVLAVKYPLGAGPATTLAATLDGGDIVALSTSTSTLYRIDPVTGVRTIISDSSHGAGPALPDVLSGQQIAVDAQGEIFVTQQYDPLSPNRTTSGSILRIDPATGNRTLFASGLPLPSGISLSRDGNLLVGEYNEPIILGSTPAVPQISVLNVTTGGTLSTIPLGGNASGFVTSVGQDAAGNLYGLITTAGRIYEIPTSGPSVTLPPTGVESLFVEQSGVIDYGGFSVNGLPIPQVARLDLATGISMTITQDPSPYAPAVGNGPAFNQPGSLTRDLAGDLLIAGFNDSPSVFSVDPTTGNRTLFAQVFGSSSFSGTLSIAVVPASVAVPEPGTVTLAILGCGALLTGARFSHRRRLRAKVAPSRCTQWLSTTMVTIGILIVLAGGSDAAQLVVMATNTTAVAGAKIYTIGIQISVADVSQAGKNVPIFVENLTFAAGPNGPLQRTGLANKGDIQSVQTSFVDNSAFSNGGSPTSDSLGTNGVAALYQDSWWYTSSSGYLQGVVDAAGDYGTVTTYPATDGSGAYTLGPTANVGPTGVLFQPNLTGQTPQDPTSKQSMSLTALFGAPGVAYLDKPQFSNLFVNGVLDIPLAQIVAKGNISILSNIVVGTSQTFISVGQHAFNVLGGNPNVDPHAFLDYATDKIVVPEPSSIVLVLVALGCLVCSSGRRRG